MNVKQVSLSRTSWEWGILRNECKRSRWGQNAVMLQSRTWGKWSWYLSKPLKVLLFLNATSSKFNIRKAEKLQKVLSFCSPMQKFAKRHCFFVVSKGICGSIHLSGIHGIDAFLPSLKSRKGIFLLSC